LPLHHHVGRAGDEVAFIQQAINRGIRNKMAFLIAELHRQFSGRQLCVFLGHLEDLASNLVGNAVPDAR